MATKLSHLLLGAFLMILVLQPFVAKSRPLKLESLQSFEQAQKGDTVIGLNQVKRYLKAFGYYTNDINLIDDHFDDSLESALQAFQENFYLKVTGKIDPDTIKTILTPRCGAPDIIRNRTSNGAMRTHGHNHGIFHLVANYSFFPGSPKWTRYDLTYDFLPDSLQEVDFQELGSSIAQAFKTWADVSPFEFEPAEQGTDGDIRIGFYRYDHGDGVPFDGPGNVVAHAFAPEDGNFHYDADEDWSFNPTSPNQMDLESVALHEIGHNLGLGHSQDPNAIMFPYIPMGTKKRDLGEDDIDGLQALYGY